MFCGELAALAEVTATVAEYVPTARTDEGCRVSVAGAVALPSTAVSHPEPEVYEIGAVRPLIVPLPALVTVICCDAGRDPPPVALNVTLFAVSAMAGGGGAAVTL